MSGFSSCKVCADSQDSHDKRIKEDDKDSVPIEFLNILYLTAFLTHKMRLKKGIPVTLMQN